MNKIEKYKTDFLNAIKQRVGEQPISDMISVQQYEIIVSELWDCLLRNTDGDIVELGCNIGTTSLVIQAGLNEFNSDKSLHVYDSFEGLPAKHEKDITTDRNDRYVEGKLKVSAENFINSFARKKMNLPQIHIGWFKDIPENEYPNKIAFAFLDGDFYTSIMDSLYRVYDKMSPGGVILIHDYGWSPLPGAKLACEDFLKDKPEKVLPDHFKNHIGKIVKQ